MAIDLQRRPTIEATSLSSVFELASNPPVQSDIRIKPGASPLVLYIARVPGSRDVFLTPIKPREKVVMASDVQSCLYYVHVNGPEDFQLRERPSSVNTDASSIPPVAEQIIKKKVPPPLPKRPAQAAPPPYPLTEQMPALPVRPGARIQGSIARKPVLVDELPYPQTPVDLPVLPPRPLPPTPPAEEEDARDSSLNENVTPSLRLESRIGNASDIYTSDQNNGSKTLEKVDIDIIPEPGTLTLIRRDPGSNEQWNVGTIHDPPVQEISSTSLLVPTAKRRTKKGGAPMYLDITNPGYEQFIHRPACSESQLSTSSNTTTSSFDDNVPAPADGVFRRRLYMPGSKYADHSYSSTNHRKHASISSASSTNELEIPRTLRYDRHHSVDLGSLNSNTPTKTDARSKGYTFTSPWNGTCEFTTGVTGKTLKCRHNLPNGTGVVEVSELRFNLPTSAKSASAHFASHRPRFFSDSGEESPIVLIGEDGRIDLSLGQERAGGGFGGKQAKLGKLIIEPAGFGMLDLLVAANLGLWWRAWERL